MGLGSSPVAALLPAGLPPAVRVKPAPVEPRAAEAPGVLSDLALRGEVDASTRNQAPGALPFMDREVRTRDLDRPVSCPAPRRRRDVWAGARGASACAGQSTLSWTASTNLPRIDEETG